MTLAPNVLISHECVDHIALYCEGRVSRFSVLFMLNPTLVFLKEVVTQRTNRFIYTVKHTRRLTEDTISAWKWWSLNTFSVWDDVMHLQQCAVTTTAVSHNAMHFSWPSVYSVTDEPDVIWFPFCLFIWKNLQVHLHKNAKLFSFLR